MPKPIDVISLLSSAAMVSRKAGTFPSEAHVVELAELRQIIAELQEDREPEQTS